MVLSTLSEITTCVASVAATVSVADPPAVIVTGLAVIVTVGAMLVTVTLAFALAVPPGPVAVAVKVAVAVGVTDCVPPVPGSVNVVLSTSSEITTCVALLAVTVSVDALPFVTAAGLAAMVTVGRTGGGVFAAPLPQAVKVESATSPGKRPRKRMAAERHPPRCRSSSASISLARLQGSVLAL
jgi:hypothetical protein